MENKNIIIAILIIIVVILAAAIAVMVMPSLSAKESKIAITGNKTFNEGDNLTVKLTDLNKTPVENVVVNVDVLDKDGKDVLNKSVTTDSKGKASVNLDLEPGNYTVNATFGGNSNFTGNNTTKKIEIKEVVQQQQVTTQQPAQGNSIHYDADLNVYYDANGKIVDPDGKHPMEVGTKYSDLVDRARRFDRGEIDEF